MGQGLNNSKVIAVENRETGIITAFVSDLPGLLVQGTSKEDVSRKLDLLLDAFIKRLENSRNNLDQIETMSLA